MADVVNYNADDDANPDGHPALVTVGGDAHKSGKYAFIVTVDSETMLILERDTLTKPKLTNFVKALVDQIRITPRPPYIFGETLSSVTDYPGSGNEKNVAVRVAGKSPLNLFPKQFPISVPTTTENPKRRKQSAQVGETLNMPVCIWIGASLKPEDVKPMFWDITIPILSVIGYGFCNGAEPIGSFSESKAFQADPNTPVVTLGNFLDQYAFYGLQGAVNVLTGFCRHRKTGGGCGCNWNIHSDNAIIAEIVRVLASIIMTPPNDDITVASCFMVLEAACLLDWIGPDIEFDRLKTVYQTLATSNSLPCGLNKDMIDVFPMTAKRYHRNNTINVAPKQRTYGACVTATTRVESYGTASSVVSSVFHVTAKPAPVPPITRTLDEVKKIRDNVKRIFGDITAAAFSKLGDANATAPQKTNLAQIKRDAQTELDNAEHAVTHFGTDADAAYAKAESAETKIKDIQSALARIIIVAGAPVNQQDVQDVVDRIDALCLISDRTAKAIQVNYKIKTDSIYKAAQNVIDKILSIRNNIRGFPTGLDFENELSVSKGEEMRAEQEYNAIKQIVNDRVAEHIKLVGRMLSDANKKISTEINKKYDNTWTQYTNADVALNDIKTAKTDADDAPSESDIYAIYQKSINAREAANNAYTIIKNTVIPAKSANDIKQLIKDIEAEAKAISLLADAVIKDSNYTTTAQALAQSTKTTVDDVSNAITAIKNTTKDIDPQHTALTALKQKISALNAKTYDRVVVTPLDRTSEIQAIINEIDIINKDVQGILGRINDPTNTAATQYASNSRQALDKARGITVFDDGNLANAAQFKQDAETAQQAIKLLNPGTTYSLSTDDVKTYAEEQTKFATLTTILGIILKGVNQKFGLNGQEVTDRTGFIKNAIVHATTLHSIFSQMLAATSQADFDKAKSGLSNTDSNLSAELQKYLASAKITATNDTELLRGAIGKTNAFVYGAMATIATNVNDFKGAIPLPSDSDIATVEADLTSLKTQLKQFDTYVSGVDTSTNILDVLQNADDAMTGAGTIMDNIASLDQKIIVMKSKAAAEEALRLSPGVNYDAWLPTAEVQDTVKKDTGEGVKKFAGANLAGPSVKPIDSWRAAIIVAFNQSWDAVNNFFTDNDGKTIDYKKTQKIEKDAKKAFKAAFTAKKIPNMTLDEITDGLFEQKAAEEGDFESVLIGLCPAYKPTITGSFITANESINISLAAKHYLAEDSFLHILKAAFLTNLTVALNSVYP